MLGNMSRLRASRLTVAALVTMAVGLLAAGYIALVMERGNATRVVDRMIEIRAVASDVKPGDAANEKPKSDKGPKDQSQAVTIPDTSGLASRLGHIKNRPVPLVIPTGDPQPEIPKDPPPPAEVIKYVGPVRLGVSMLALVSFNDKQKVLAEGRTFGVTVDGQTKTTKLISVGEDKIVVEAEGGQQREIAKADSNGEVISFLGNKPNRTKPVVMKQASDTKAKGRANFIGDSNQSVVEAKQAKIAARFNEIYQQAKKAQGGEPNSDLREKIIEKMQADGIDRATAEKSLEK